MQWWKTVTGLAERDSCDGRLVLRLHGEPLVEFGATWTADGRSPHFRGRLTTADGTDVGRTVVRKMTLKDMPRWALQTMTGALAFDEAEFRAELPQCDAVLVCRVLTQDAPDAAGHTKILVDGGATNVIVLSLAVPLPPPPGTGLPGGAWW